MERCTLCGRSDGPFAEYRSRSIFGAVSYQRLCRHCSPWMDETNAHRRAPGEGEMMICRWVVYVFVFIYIWQWLMWFCGIEK